MCDSDSRGTIQRIGRLMYERSATIADEFVAHGRLLRSEPGDWQFRWPALREAFRYTRVWAGGDLKLIAAHCSPVT